MERFRSEDGSEDAEEGDFKRFIGNLAMLDVPDNVDPTHDDFNRGEVLADKLIAMAERYQNPSIAAKRKEGGKGDTTGAKKRIKKADAAGSYDWTVCDDNYRKFVSERTASEDWLPVLLGDDGKASRRQHQVYVKEYFLLKNVDMNPPENRDAFNIILKDTVRQYLEIFRHAPPFELFTAFLNSTAESGPSIWKQWCENNGHEEPSKEQLKGSPDMGNKEFRWILWKTAHACARDMKSDAETAATAGALAEAFGNTAAAKQMAAKYRRPPKDENDLWQNEVRAKAVEFAAKAVAAAAAAAAAAPLETVTEAGSESMPLPPPPPGDAAAAAAAAAAVAAATTATTPPPGCVCRVCPSGLA